MGRRLGRHTFVAVVDRLLPFEVDVTRVASRARTDERGPVHGVDELPALLPGADVLVVFGARGELPAARHLAQHPQLFRADSPCIASSKIATNINQ